MRKERKSKITFETIDTEQKAYILGLLGADGCRSSKRNVVRLKLQEQDVGLLTQVANYIYDNYQLGYTRLDNPQHSNTYYLDIIGEVICKQLMKHGIVPMKSFILKPPEQLLKELYPHYIRGLFDGDGHIVVKPDLECGVAGSKYIIEFIANEMKEKLNIETGLGKKDKIFTFRCFSYNAILFIKYIYTNSSIFMSRKFEKAAPFFHANLPLYKMKFWNDLDIELLKKYYPKAPKTELLAMFPKTKWQSILDKASELKIKRINKDTITQRYWKKEDIFLLLNLYSESYDYIDIADRLDRTIPAVKDKLKRLNYGR